MDFETQGVTLLHIFHLHYRHAVVAIINIKVWLFVSLDTQAVTPHLLYNLLLYDNLCCQHRCRAPQLLVTYTTSRVTITTTCTYMVHYLCRHH